MIPSIQNGKAAIDAWLGLGGGIDTEDTKDTAARWRGPLSRVSPAPPLLLLLGLALATPGLAQPADPPADTAAPAPKTETPPAVPETQEERPTEPEDSDSPTPPAPKAQAPPPKTQAPSPKAQDPPWNLEACAGIAEAAEADTKGSQDVGKLCAKRVMKRASRAIKRQEYIESGRLLRAVLAHYPEGEPVDPIRRELERTHARLVSAAFVFYGAEIRRHIKRLDFNRAQKALTVLGTRVTDVLDDTQRSQHAYLTWRYEHAQAVSDLNIVDSLVRWTDGSQPLAVSVVQRAAAVLDGVGTRLEALTLTVEKAEGRSTRYKRTSELKHLGRRFQTARQRLEAVELEQVLRLGLAALESDDQAAAARAAQEATAHMEGPEWPKLPSWVRTRVAWRTKELRQRLEAASEKASEDAEDESADEDSDDCAPSREVGVFITPRTVRAEEPLRLLLTSERGGEPPVAKVHRRSEGEPPNPDGAQQVALSALGGEAARVYGWTGETHVSAGGAWRVVISREDGTQACLDFEVAPTPDDAKDKKKAKKRAAKKKSAAKRPPVRQWGAHEENLYSLWIHHLFDQPEGTTWPSLHTVTSAPERNLLHNHLGEDEDAPPRSARQKPTTPPSAKGEDDTAQGGRQASKAPLAYGLDMAPDCADLVLFLRAYFSWKMGLPFGKFLCPVGRRSRSTCGPGVAASALRIDTSGRSKGELDQLWATARKELRALPLRWNISRDARARWNLTLKAVGGSPESDLLMRLPNGLVKDAKEKSLAERRLASWFSEAAHSRGYPAQGSLLGPYCKGTACTLYRVAGYIGFHSGPDWHNRRLSKHKFQRFLGMLEYQTQSNQFRAPLSVEHSALYPVALQPESLRPGTIYVDPYSHVMTITSVGRTDASGGATMLAVDGQPDGTIAIKRYWRGTFVFGAPTQHVGPGFKFFRPIVATKTELRPLANYELEKRRSRPFSMDQHALTVGSFYDTVDGLLQPGPIDAVTAYREAHEALLMLLKYRTTSIAMGDNYIRENPGRVVRMPEGREIFLTTGPWEDFSTPCRDLRLLVAIDVIRDFPASVERSPTRYRLPDGVSPTEMRRRLEDLHRKWASELTFEYLRSDQTPFTLEMAQVLERIETLHDSYNPNDCSERRWGAPEDSAELSTCKRRAPKKQRLQMERHAHWFRERYSCH